MDETVHFVTGPRSFSVQIAATSCLKVSENTFMVKDFMSPQDMVQVRVGST